MPGNQPKGQTDYGHCMKLFICNSEKNEIKYDLSSNEPNSLAIKIIYYIEN